VVTPSVVRQTQPEYTDEARRAHINSTAMVSLMVGEDGTPSQVRLVRPVGFGLDDQALRAVSKWQFRPGSRNGQPVAMRVQIETMWRLLDPLRQGQRVRLIFNTPVGGSRPELQKGETPENPRAGGYQSVSLKLTVDALGNVSDASLLEATDADWGAEVLNRIKGWRFLGIATPVSGTFEIETGTPSAGPPREIVPAPTEAQDPSLPAPQLLSPPNGAEFDIVPRLTTARWSPVTGALTYLLETDYMDGTAWHAASLPRGFAYSVPGRTEFTFSFVGAQRGRWRVWALGSDGRAGNPSEWREFQYKR